MVGCQLLLKKKTTRECKILLHNKGFLEEAKEFDAKSERVDDFYATVLSKGSSYTEQFV